MSALLALCSSLLFGTSDYIGGHLTKKHKVMTVTGAIQIFGFLVGLMLLLVTRTWIAPSLSWSGYFLPGVCAGLIGFAGLNAFFAGLATGRMGVVSMRLPTFFILTAMAIKYRTVGNFSKKDLRFLFLAGIGDFLANIALGEASTMGLVSAAVVLASLYPLVTSVYAFKFSHERLHKLQYVGIIFAVAGVSLISMG